MPQYAYFDSTQPAPQPVIGWYDTDALKYPNLPTAANLLALTPAQWATRMTGQWAHDNGALVAYTPPVIPPTLAQQAGALIAVGLAITSTGTPALNGVYAIASGVPFGREDIGTEAQFVSTFAEFTNGTQTLEWPLKDGTFVTFPSTAAFLNFAKAAGQFYAACQAVMATGSGPLPKATATIP